MDEVKSSMVIETEAKDMLERRLELRTLGLLDPRSNQLSYTSCGGLRQCYYIILLTVFFQSILSKIWLPSFKSQSSTLFKWKKNLLFAQKFENIYYSLNRLKHPVLVLIRGPFKPSLFLFVKIDQRRTTIRETRTERERAGK
jgi:hypothetical protein